MSNPRALRMAVIGCGLMGGRHAETLANTPGFALACVQDAVAASAEKLAAQFGVPAAVDYDAILADKSIDGVVICLPSSMHASFGARAARAGKHVILEKPIDVSIDRAQELIDEASKAGVLLTVISQNRFIEGAATLKKALDAHLLGDILLVNVAIKWHRDDPYYTKSDWRGRFAGEGGGVMMNQGIHYTDLLLWFLGPMESARSLLTSSREVIETEDVAGFLMRSQGGAIVTLAASTAAYPGFPEKMEIHGTLGSATLEQGNLTEWKHKSGSNPPVVEFAPPLPADLNSKLVPFQRQYIDILEALREGRPPLVTPQEALLVIETILLAYQNKF